MRPAELNFKKIIQKYKEFLIVSALFVPSVLLVGLDGNFPINDDWIFAHQVDAFMQGIFTISALIDPSFILQGLIGTVWAKLFGFSFTSLRVLTLFITLASLYTFNLILKRFTKSTILTSLALITFIFNPIIYTSTFTFMTENYFLLFMLLSVYFYIKYFDSDDARYLCLYLGTFFSGLSLLVRQLGVLIFIPILLVLGVSILRKVIPNIKQLKKFKLSKKDSLTLFALFANTLLFGLFCLIWLTWPKHTSNPAELALFKGLIEPKYFLERLRELWLVVPYFGIYLLPFSPLLLNDLTKKAKLTLVIAAILFASFIYKNDIFFLGNVFYLEGLYIKSDFRINLSILDNLPFKLFYAFLVSFCITLFLATLVKGASSIVAFLIASREVSIPALIKRKNWHIKTDAFLALTAILLFLFVLISSDFYERYLLPMFLVIIILVVKYLNRTKITFESLSRINKYILVLCVFIYTVVPFVLNQDFMAYSRLTYSSAQKIKESTGLDETVYVDSAQEKYNIVRKNRDYTGLQNPSTASEYLCYVQPYTLNKDGSTLFKVAAGLNDLFEEHFTANKPPKTRKNSEISRAKNNLDKLRIDTSYRSILYHSVGKEARVGAWCDEL